MGTLTDKKIVPIFALKPESENGSQTAKRTVAPALSFSRVCIHFVSDTPLLISPWTTMVKRRQSLTCYISLVSKWDPSLDGMWLPLESATDPGTLVFSSQPWKLVALSCIHQELLPIQAAKCNDRRTLCIAPPSQIVPTEYFTVCLSSLPGPPIAWHKQNNAAVITYCVYYPLRTLFFSKYYNSECWQCKV